MLERDAVTHDELRRHPRNGTSGRAADGALFRERANFVRAERRRELVEHAVDELVAIGATVGLRELDGFVDHHAVGNVEPVAQLPRADHEDRALDGRELRCAAVEIRRNQLDQCIVVRDDARPELAEIRVVGLSESSRFHELRADRLGRIARKLALIEPLQHELARAAARSRPHWYVPTRYLFGGYAISAAIS